MGGDGSDTEHKNFNLHFEMTPTCNKPFVLNNPKAGQNDLAHLFWRRSFRISPFWWTAVKKKMLRWILVSISLVAVISGLPQESRIYWFSFIFSLEISLCLLNEHIFLYLLVTGKCKAKKILLSMIVRENLSLVILNIVNIHVKKSRLE